MRVLVTVTPALGHLHPMIPLLRALVMAGHEVQVATTRSFAGVVERQGLDVTPVGADWEASEVDRSMPGWVAGRTLGKVKAMIRLVGRGGMVDDLLALAADRPPDVVVRDAYEYGGLVAARRLGVPVAVHGITVRHPPEILQRAVGRQIGALREQYGLDPDPGMTDSYRDVWMNFMPPSFVPEGWPELEHEHYLRPGLFDRSADEGLPAWVGDLDGPVVYATMGTVFNQREDVFARIVEALGGEGYPVILTVGRNVDPAALGPVPANVRVERYIPQSLLLDRVSAVVTHGGYNTVMSALGHGVPVCCLPLSADHPFNAQRCAELGVGKVCTTWTPRGSWYPVVDPADLDPAVLRAAVRELLDDPSYLAAAGRMRAEIAGMPGAEEGVRLVEELVARSRATRAPAGP